MGQAGTRPYLEGKTHGDYSCIGAIEFMDAMGIGDELTSEGIIQFYWVICSVPQNYFFGIFHYILVQQSAHVSLSGLPVLRTLYKSMHMHKSSNSRNWEFCVFLDIYVFFFFTFGSFHQKSGFIVQKLNNFFSLQGVPF